MASSKARSATASRLCMILSPTKTMQFDSAGDASRTVLAATQPSLLSKAVSLAAHMKGMSKSKLKDLMKISDSLATLNMQRFKDFEDTVNANGSALSPGTTPSGGNVWRRACHAFTGPAFLGLDAHTLANEDLEWAQDKLHILCGLYGVLRPLDLIQPYRLEMGVRMAVAKCQSLYEYWQPDVTAALTQSLGTEQPSVLVNLASQEYSRAVDFAALPSTTKVVTAVFKDDGRVKSAYAKRARGLMCRYIIEHRVVDVAGLTQFCEEGYRLDTRASTDDTLVFVRSGGARHTATKRKAAAKAASRPTGKQQNRKPAARAGAGTGAGAGTAADASAGATGRGAAPTAQEAPTKRRRTRAT